MFRLPKAGGRNLVCYPLFTGLKKFESHGLELVRSMIRMNGHSNLTCIRSSHDIWDIMISVARDLERFDHLITLWSWVSGVGVSIDFIYKLFI